MIPRPGANETQVMTALADCVRETVALREQLEKVMIRQTGAEGDISKLSAKIDSEAMATRADFVKQVDLSGAKAELRGLDSKLSGMLAKYEDLVDRLDETVRYRDKQKANSEKMVDAQEKLDGLCRKQGRKKALIVATCRTITALGSAQREIDIATVLKHVPSDLYTDGSTEDADL